MANQNPDMGELITTTLRKRGKNLADTVSKNNAGLFQLRRKKKIRKVDGGRTITEPLMYGESTNYQRYQGYDAITFAPQEVLDSSEYVWKQWAATVTLSGRERRMNSGSSQQIDMLAARITNAEKTIANRMAEDFYSDGTADGGLQVGGLQLLVSDAPGATVGKIDSGTALWWDNQRRMIAGGPTTANIYGEMENLLLACSRGTDTTDIILSDNTYYTTFSQSLHDKQRFESSKMADAGFRNLMFEGVPVVADGKMGGFAPPGMFFLNCSEIAFVMHKDANNTVLDGPTRAINQDGISKTIIGMGNMTLGNRMLQGRLGTA